jgi:hypothetical protein
MQKIKNILFSQKNLKRDIGITILFFLTAISFARAGNLDSPGNPASTMFTLNEIYQRLITNQSATESGHLFSPSADPASSLHTLKEIYDAIPTIDATRVKSGQTYLGISGTLLPSGGTAEVGQILVGKTFFGSNQADWNLQTGTMPNIGQQNITPSIADQTISVGYHDGTGKISGDADLISANIKNGINLFGVSGNSNVVDTSTGDAVVNEIVAGKKAWVDGSEVVGAMTSVGQQLITPGTTNQTITLGYHNGTGYVSGDADLISANIKSGINLFGVDGNSNVVNTASGTAVAGDLKSGKIAWVGGTQVTGNFVSQEKTATSEGQEVAPDSGNWLSKVTIAITNLIAGNVKKSATVGGVAGTYSGFAGTAWTPNGSGSGSTAINQIICEDQGANWKWFEDANGDGDTTDSEDGICVKTATVTSDSWNGAEQMNTALMADTTMASGTTSSVTVSGTPWSVNAYKNEIVKIISGTASGCWGIVKTNTTSTITVYGSWLKSTYANCDTTPDATSHIQVFDDNKYDNSFIGDYGCTGNFPSGTVTFGLYPTSGTIALAVTDCYDGKRDLLPNETDRSVLSGTATTADATSITDSSQTMTTNVWIGQKVLITGGTGVGSYGIVESNDGTKLTVSDWLIGADPANNSTFKIIYILPRTSYVGGTGMSQIIGGTSDDSKANLGPLMEKQLKEWTGTKLPTSQDFFGFCSPTAGDADSTAGSSNYSSSGASSNKTIGNYGSNVGRGLNASPNDEYMDLSNSGSWEWLSEQHYYNNARIAGNSACSYFSVNNVINSNRFRAVFRP